MGNKLNTYGYCVFKNVNNIPLHIVEVYSSFYHGFHVFSNARQVYEFINREKPYLEYCLGKNISYDLNFEFSSNLVKTYKTATSGLCSKISDKCMYIRNF